MEADRPGICKMCHTNKILISLFYPRKTPKVQLFWHNIENGRCFTIFLEQIASLCTQIRINPSYFVITYNNSGLTPTNYTDRVNFCVNSCTFYPSPKQFYAIGGSGKFHVWRQISQPALKSKLLVLGSFYCLALLIS